MGTSPFGLRFQDDKNIRDTRRHWVGGNFGGTDFGEHAIDFRECLDRFLQLILHFNRCRQTGTRNANSMQRDIAFVQAGDKLAADTCRQQTRQDDNDDCNGNREFAIVHRCRQYRHIGFSGPYHHPALCFFYFTGQKECNRCRNKGEGENHCRN